jgi:predicted nuclease of predicted toxin-antitoxin system
MVKFLIDVNLPYYFSLWNSGEFIHQNDINDKASDEDIWQYAKTHKLTIITKDVDFSNKILLHKPPPKVIHIRFGNMKMSEFFIVMTKLWDDSIKINETHKLVNVFVDRIEGIN